MKDVLMENFKLEELSKEELINIIKSNVISKYDFSPNIYYSENRRLEEENKKLWAIVEKLSK
jgi:hypothetical protein